ncbi:unnamed protein product [Chondrus crispus]|uniref:Uncharacterized protein n=1 Tax=Chondrus crispus TaxID=2769 RepID=R7QKV2_CHOCR|nr:unnamed protein product [Chondrus crispus]CDF38000.1 unnamed protein product [Chondrus crispus]|eukprot:XP_005717869.1 unnamed protein product [Chondrus crispus]
MQHAETNSFFTITSVISPSPSRPRPREGSSCEVPIPARRTHARARTASCHAVAIRLWPSVVLFRLPLTTSHAVLHHPQGPPRPRPSPRPTPVVLSLFSSFAAEVLRTNRCLSLDLDA